MWPDFHFDSIMVRRHTLYHFNSLKFFQIIKFFNLNNYRFIEYKCSINADYILLVDNIPLLIFCLLVLWTDERQVLNSIQFIIIDNLFVFSFSYTSFASYFWNCLMHMHLKLLLFIDELMVFVILQVCLYPGKDFFSLWSLFYLVLT